MGVPLYPISQTASAYKIPKAGADGKIASGFIPDLSGSIITSGLLALARGGLNADLSATGGSNQFLKQASAGAVVSASSVAVTLPAGFGVTAPELEVGGNIYEWDLTGKLSTGEVVTVISISPLIIRDRIARVS